MLIYPPLLLPSFLIYLFQDFLEDLYDRVQSLSNNGWKVDSGKNVFRFFHLFILV